MDLSLKIARPAEGTPIPETLAELLEIIAQNTQVLGPQISEGSGALPMQVYRRQGDQETELTGEDSAIWIETNAENRPIALKLFWGDAWHNFGDIPRGTTAERDALSNIGDWEPFYDTDLKALLVYDPDWGKWVTMEGSPGDIKAVHAVDEAAAVAANPGWIIYEAARGSVLMGVDPDSDEDFSFTGIEDETEQLLRLPGRVLGKHTTNIRTDELPEHRVLHWDVNYDAQQLGDSGTVANNANEMPVVGQSNSIGASNPLDIRQQSLTVFYLIKANTDQPTVENSERNGLAKPMRATIDPANVPHEDEVAAANAVLQSHRYYVRTASDTISPDQIYEAFQAEAGTGRRIVLGSKNIIDAALKYGAMKTGSGQNEEVVDLDFNLINLEQDDIYNELTNSPTFTLPTTDQETTVRNSTFYPAP